MTKLLPQPPPFFTPLRSALFWQLKHLLSSNISFVLDLKLSCYCALTYFKIHITKSCRKWQKQISKALNVVRFDIYRVSKLHLHATLHTSIFIKILPVNPTLPPSDNRCTTFKHSSYNNNNDTPLPIPKQTTKWSNWKHYIFIYNALFTNFEWYTVKWICAVYKLWVFCIFTSIFTLHMNFFLNHCNFIIRKHFISYQL